MLHVRSGGGRAEHGGGRAWVVPAAVIGGMLLLASRPPGAEAEIWQRLEFPGKRYGPVGILDAGHDRMIMLGGTIRAGSSNVPGNSVWAMSLGDELAWTRLQPVQTGPDSASIHRAVYDPVRNRMLVVSANSAVWALSLGESPDWTPLSPAGSPPSSRTGQSVIYDPNGDRLVVFGGYTAGGYLNDLWALSLGSSPTWTQLIPSGGLPPGREGHSAIYDPVRRRMIIFAGTGENPDPLLNPCSRSDVWALSMTGTLTWTELVPGGSIPGVRGGHQAVYDSAGDRMLIHGGGCRCGMGICLPMSDLWTLSLSGTPQWTQLSAANAAAVRGHLMILDTARRQLVVYGGASNGSRVSKLPLTMPLGWAEAYQSDDIPPGRERHAAIYDPTHDRMVMFGGQGPALQGLCILEPGPAWKWSSLPAGPGPTKRVDHVMVYDAVRQQAVLFGGRDATEMRLNDTWALSLATLTWTQMAPGGSLPGGTARHTAVYDAAGDRMIVWGGEGAPSSAQNLWQLRFSPSPTWSLLSTSNAPISRLDAASFFDPVRTRMVVFGGWQDVSPPYSNLVYSLDLTSGNGWTLWAPGGTQPNASAGHAVIHDLRTDRMIVYGGAIPYNRIWALTLDATPEWQVYWPGGEIFPGRTEHTAVYDERRHRMIMYGGFDDFAPYPQDAYALILPPGTTAVDPPLLVNELASVSPNPAVEQVSVSFRLRQSERVRVAIYSIDGRRVRKLVDGTLEAGGHQIVWDLRDGAGSRVAPGVYLCSGDSPAGRWTRRVVVLR